MDHREFPPPAALAPHVRCLWTLDGRADGGLADPVFPDGSPEIILNDGEPIWARTPAGELVEQPTVMLVGQITAPFVVQPAGALRLFGIRLEPFGAAALCDNMSSITDHWTDISTLLPARKDRLNDALQVLLARRDVPHHTVVAACRSIRKQRGNIMLDELAASLGVTPRTLQRRFACEVGIPPKLLARITRFQHVFSAWRHDPRTLAGVAADCGYFDQSHLVRDFRDFAGEAPAAALAEQKEFTAFFLPS